MAYASCSGTLTTYIDSTGGYSLSCNVEWSISQALLTLDQAASLGTAIVGLFALAFAFRFAFRFILNR